MARQVDKIRLGKAAPGREAVDAASPRAMGQTPRMGVSLDGLSQELSTLLPCALYQADLSLRLSFVSENIVELLGLESQDVMASGTFWDRLVFVEDLRLFAGKVKELRVSGSAALIHRMLDTRELPVWVSHRMKKVRIDGADAVLGSLTLVGSDNKLQSPDLNTICGFVHKIGNHFQLMNLIANSLGKTMPDSRDIDALQETLDRAIELVRTFSDYNQPPACLPHIGLGEVIKAAIFNGGRFFQEKGVGLKENIHESVDDVTVSGDPFLLETAFGHILRNALEATEVGGVVSVSGDIESFARRSLVAKIRVRDHGRGIDNDDLTKVTVPFFTSKKGHDGLGLSLSARFIELHGGLLRVGSAVGKGTEVEISLPVIASRKDAL